jgi:hypothetical protein
MRKELILLGALALSAAAPAASAPTPNLFVSKSDPALTLRVDKSYVALPKVRKELFKTAVAERSIFVDGRKGEPVKSVVIVQAEHVLPGVDFRYRFPAKPPHKLGAQTYGLMTFAYDEAADAVKNPGSEIGVTREALTKAGYIPAKLYRVARLARVANPAGTHEIIIFLFENIDAEPPRGPEDDPTGGWILKPDEAAAVVKRLESAVHVIKG